MPPIQNSSATMSPVQGHTVPQKGVATRGRRLWQFSVWTVRPLQQSSSNYKYSHIRWPYYVTNVLFELGCSCFLRFWDGVTCYLLQFLASSSQHARSSTGMGCLDQCLQSEESSVSLIDWIEDTTRRYNKPSKRKMTDALLSYELSTTWTPLFRIQIQTRLLSVPYLDSETESPTSLAETPPVSDYPFTCTGSISLSSQPTSVDPYSGNK